MAALHHQLGGHGEALRCVSEAVSLSQEARDDQCLQRALAWMGVLCNYDQQMTSLLAAINERCSLPPIKSPLDALTSHKLAEQLLSLINCVPKNSSGLFTTTEYTNLSVWSTAATLWQEWMGTCNVVSGVYSQLVLNCSPALYHSSTIPLCTENTALCLCNIAIALAGEGQYSTCHALLKHCHSLFQSGSKQTRVVHTVASHVHVSQYILQGNYSQAEKVLETLVDTDPVYVHMRTCEIASIRGDSPAALHEVSVLLTMKEVTDSRDLLIEVHLLAASTLCNSDNVHVAVSHVCEALGLAKKTCSHLMYALTVMHVVAIQLKQGLLEPDCQINTPERYIDGDKRHIHPYKYFNFSKKMDIDALDSAYSIIMGELICLNCLQVLSVAM